MQRRLQVQRGEASALLYQSGQRLAVVIAVAGETVTVCQRRLRRADPVPGGSETAPVGQAQLHPLSALGREIGAKPGVAGGHLRIDLLQPGGIEAEAQPAQRQAEVA